MRELLTLLIIILFFFNADSQCLPFSENMILLDHWDDNSLYPSGNPETHYNDCWGYVDNSGNEYAILGGRDSFFIFDVTVPNSIIKVDAIYQGDTSIWRDFKIFGNHLYSVVDGGQSVNKGVVIYDLSPLPNPIVKVKELNSEFPNCHNIYIDVDNARLYAGGFNGSQSVAGRDDICIYDLSVNPADPSLLDCVNLDAIESGASNYFYFHDIFVRNNIVYGSHGYSGYYIWDMTDISDIKLLGSLDNSSFDSGYVHSSWNSDDNNHAIVATELGSPPKVYWIDQSTPSNIQIIDDYKEPLCTNVAGNNHRPHNPYIIGDKIYLSHYHDGLIVLEIDFVQDTLGRVGYYDTYPDNVDYTSGSPGNWGAYPFLPSGTILASDLKYGLYTLKYIGQTKYTFVGPGTDWGTSSNWDFNIVPPSDFEGTIVIDSDCVIGSSIIPNENVKLTINTGVTLTK